MRKIKICPCGTDHFNLGLYCSPACKIKAWQKNYFKSNHRHKVDVRSITIQYEKTI